MRKPKHMERVLQIRLTPDQLVAMKKVAERNHLLVSVWARQVLLKDLETQHKAVKAKRALKNES